jgi:hypothetical protein
MRDIIWTFIIVWVVYKLMEIFRGAGSKKNYSFGQESQRENHGRDDRAPQRKDVKSAIQKRAEKEGEYVDFEEIK